MTPTRKEIINLISKYMRNYTYKPWSYEHHTPETYYHYGEWWRYHMIKRYWNTHYSDILKAHRVYNVPLDALCRAASMGSFSATDDVEDYLFWRLRKMHIL